MNGERFDELYKASTGATSRRGVLRLIGGGAAAGALATAGLAQAAEAKRKKSRKATKDKKAGRGGGANPFAGIDVSGVNQDTGKKGFVGKLDITGFVAEGETLLAVGTLTGQVIGKPAGNAEFPRKVNQTIEIAVEAINGVELASLGDGAAAASGVSAQQLACEILTLTLGPLDLNLLGLRIQLNQVELDITAIPGGGLLGDLLCAVANLLSGGGPLAGLLTQIAGLLNRILGLFG